MTTTRTITLGDRELNRIGLGTNRLTETDANRDFIGRAFQAGIQMIDTAHLYTDGASETTIGKAFADAPERPLIATKGGYRPGGGPEQIFKELDESFERLRTDVIDLYYVHRVHEDTPLAETVKRLAEHRGAGRIGHIGLSEVSVAQIEAAREIVPIAAVQNEFSLAERKHEEVVDYCELEGIAFVPFFPLRGVEETPLIEVAARLAATPKQIALAWLLHRSTAMLPIPGTLSPEHLAENLGALDVELSEADFARIGAGA